MDTYEIAIGSALVDIMGISANKLSFSISQAIAILSTITCVAVVIFIRSTHRRVGICSLALIPLASSMVVSKSINYTLSAHEPVAGPIRAISTGDGRVTLTKSGAHFHATIMVNGVSINGMVDTGATRVSLSREDAKKVGLDVDSLRYTEITQTANGDKLFAPVVLESVGIGGIEVQNIAGSVDQGENFETLIGMSFLGLMDRVSIEDNKMTLVLLNEISL